MGARIETAGQFAGLR